VQVCFARIPIFNGNFGKKYKKLSNIPNICGNFEEILGINKFFIPLIMMYLSWPEQRSFKTGSQGSGKGPPIELSEAIF
jgi:hypothetical protein